MGINEKYYRLTKFVSRLGLLLLGLIILASISAADERVYPSFRIETLNADTVWAGVNNHIGITLQNHIKLRSMSLGFELFSPDGVEWTWIAQDEGYGPEGKYTGLQAATVTPGRRMELTDVVWDVSDLRFIEQNMDGQSPDSFYFYGLAETGGLETGGMDILMNAHFLPGGVAEGEIKTLCIDTASIFPDGEWLFTDFLGLPIIPYTMDEAECKPVKLLPCCVPYVIRVVQHYTYVEVCRTLSAYITFLDYEVESFYGEVISCTGEGTVEMIQNDNRINLNYTPHQNDVGKTIETTIRVCNSSGCSEPYIQTVNVTGRPPTIDVGLVNNTAIPDNMFVKVDLIIDDPNWCETLTYAVLSGPGEFDIDGLYTWIPTVADVGLNHFVDVMTTDGRDTAFGSFEIEVISGEGLNGDANLDGGVNVGDIVYLINYIFKSGPFSPVPNLADVNADCVLNVADPVYLINYVFKRGPAPVLGCVY